VKRKIVVPLVAVGIAGLFATIGGARGEDGPHLSDVPTANTKAIGVSPVSRLSAELKQFVVAQGATPLENPQGIVTHYGYENDVASPGDPTQPLMVPVVGTTGEAQKTEPDKNTYLVFRDGLAGADPHYDYGTEFLFQGHEGAATVAGAKQGLITRINLDADAAHRVTLLATKDVDGNDLKTIDGSSWEPLL